MSNIVPTVIIIAGKKYYNADDLNKYDPAYFIGANKYSRGILKKKNISQFEYIYAYEKDGSWKISNEFYSRAKLLLSENWTCSNVPKMIVKQKSSSSDTKIKMTNSNKVTKDELKDELNDESKDEPKDELNDESKDKSKDESKDEPKDNSIIKYDLKLLKLNDEEKFKDKDGNIIDIEVRGERKHNKCYFRVRDIMNGFNMLSLMKNIKDEKSSYIYDDDYIIINNLSSRISATQHVSKNEMFLTYKGILRVLFSSRSEHIRYFINWATEILFTVHLGTIEQKQILSASLMGLDPQIVKDVFNIHPNKIPAVYLFLIGQANILLNNCKYPDNYILCRYGCTEDISRRSSEHQRNFKKQFNVEIRLLLYSIIDPKYIFDAENSIKQYFKANKIDDEDKTELIIIDKNIMDQIKQHYRMIQNSYIGRYEELNKQILESDRKINDMQHEKEKMILQHEKEKMILQHEKEKMELKYILELKDKELLLEKLNNRL